MARCTATGASSRIDACRVDGYTVDYYLSANPALLAYMSQIRNKPVADIYRCSHPVLDHYLPLSYPGFRLKESLL